MDKKEAAKDAPAAQQQVSHSFDKETPQDKVTKPGAPRTSKSFGEPKWGT